MLKLIQNEGSLMKKYALSMMAFFLFMTSSLSSRDFNEEECRYYLSVCTIFQDEADYLKEWLEYHRVVGVEHFYLYNNNSVDNYIDVLQPYIDQGVVDLFDWPSPETKDWTPYQQKAYNHCIGYSTGQTRWLAVIDTDEFVVPVQNPDLKSFLETFDSLPFVGGIHIGWQFYGTSWCKKVPEDKLMIETLVLKAKANYPHHQEYKTICKPHTVDYYRVHDARYKKGFQDVTPDGGSGVISINHADKIRINHYWTRDEDFFFNVKIPRRWRCCRAKYSPMEIKKIFSDLNAVEDKAIFRFIPELRERIFSSEMPVLP